MARRDSTAPLVLDLWIWSLWQPGHQIDAAAFSKKGSEDKPAVSLDLWMDLMIPYSPTSRVTLRSVPVHPV